VSDKIDLTKSENFVSELENLFGWTQELMSNLDAVELDVRQKSQVAGMFMGITTQFTHMVVKLKEWGYGL